MMMIMTIVPSRCGDGPGPGHITILLGCLFVHRAETYNNELKLQRSRELLTLGDIRTSYESTSVSSLEGNTQRTEHQKERENGNEKDARFKPMTCSVFWWLKIVPTVPPLPQGILVEDMFLDVVTDITKKSFAPRYMKDPNSGFTRGLLVQKLRGTINPLAKCKAAKTPKLNLCLLHILVEGS